MQNCWIASLSVNSAMCFKDVEKAKNSQINQRFKFTLWNSEALSNTVNKLIKILNATQTKTEGLILVVTSHTAATVAHAPAPCVRR